jgi:hypothetical protein
VLWAGAAAAGRLRAGAGGFAVDWLAPLANEEVPRFACPLVWRERLTSDKTPLATDPASDAARREGDGRPTWLPLADPVDTKDAVPLLGATELTEDRPN